MDERAALKNRIEQALGERQLVWFGPRGTDANPLRQFHQRRSVFSLTCPANDLDAARDVSLETLSGLRDETNLFNLDTPDWQLLSGLRGALSQALAEPSVLVPYRPSTFLMACLFPSLATTQYLGMPVDVYVQFSHKAWTEVLLRREGIDVLPWRYVADGDTTPIEELLRAGPVVLRSNHSGGGTGFELLTDRDIATAKLPEHSDGFLAVAPYFEKNIPLNVHCCVFPSGTVTVHAPSLQIIGVPECTPLMFGYGGNDYGAIASLDDAALDALERMCVTTGRWMHRHGFIGAFGIDAMLYEGTVYFIEVNPRFQGSSEIAAMLDEHQGQPDSYADHIAAHLGIEPGPRPSLRDQARNQPAWAQTACYSHESRSMHLGAELCPTLPGLRVTHVPNDGVDVGDGAMFFKVTTDHAITKDGHSLEPDAAAEIARLRGAYAPVEEGAKTEALT